MNLEFTGEMFLPWTEIDSTHYEHVHRYFVAGKFVKGKKVLDIACGEGYGCKLLAQNSQSVIGIDINKNTIAHAKKKYQSENIEFLEGSMTQIPISGENVFDVITCFEALEHIKEQDKMLSEVKRLLTDNGIFLISTPNKEEYSYRKNQKNPYHQKELTLNEFHELLQSFFPFVKLYGQKTFVSSNIWPLSDRPDNFKEITIERINDEYRESKIEDAKADFFVAIASINDLKDIEIDPSFIINTAGAKTYISRIEEELENKNNEISTSESYVSKLEDEISTSKSYVSKLESEKSQYLEKLNIHDQNRRKYFSSRL